MTGFDTSVELTVLGGPVGLYRAGDAGPPVLLLHGAMLDTAHGVWHEIVPQLASDHRVYAIDMPRHGRSRPWTGMLGDDFYSHFMAELLDQLGLDRAALVGLSMGGGVAHRFALSSPGRVSALVAIELAGWRRRAPTSSPQHPAPAPAERPHAVGGRRTQQRGDRSGRDRRRARGHPGLPDAHHRRRRPHRLLRPSGCARCGDPGVFAEVLQTPAGPPARSTIEEEP